MKIIIFVFVCFFSLNAFAADGEATGYFGALWDFIDWVYEAFQDIKQAILDFLAEVGKVLILWYIQWKIATVQYIWSVVEPIIDSLNLTDVISQLFGSLSSDVKMFITELRIGEGINLLLSAYATRSILKFIGW